MGIVRSVCSGVGNSMDLIRSYQHVRRMYRTDLLAFRSQTNIFRFAVFSIISLLISLSVLFFVRPELPRIHVLFVLLMAASVLFFFLSVAFRADEKRRAPFLHLALVHIGVFFLFAWGTAQILFGEGDVRGFVTYVALVIAIAAVFSLEPLYYFAVSVLSLSSLYLLSTLFEGIDGGQIRNYFIFLINSVVFGWVVSVMHYYTVLEIFFVKKQMEEQERRAELALTGGNLGYWNWNIEKEVIDVDARWSALLGYEAKRGRIRFDEFFRMVVPEDRKRVAEAVQGYFDGESDQYSITFRMETKEGDEKWIYAEGRVTNRDRNGKPLFMHGIHQDVQELREQQSKLQESELRFRTYTENAPVGVFITDGLRFTYVNPEAIHLSGYSEKELLDGVTLYRLVHPDDRKKLRNDIRRLLKDRETKNTYLYRIVSKTGETHWFETRLSTINWKKRMFLLSAVDITERRQAEEKLKEYATYDELTGVFNRRVGLDLLEREMVSSHREVSTFTVCFIDVNGLKVVNDTFGHDAGDELIKSVVSVATKEMRSGDIICRLGGDEFLLLFKACDMRNAKKIKKRMEDRFVELNKEPRRQYDISVSYGMLEYGRDVQLSVQELIHRADQRMYEDKLARKAQRESRLSSR